MKIAILYTAYRQFKEIDYAPFFWSRASWMREHADIVYHCNNPEIDDDQLRTKLSRIPCHSLHVFRTDLNCGYGYGQFEAIREIWDQLQNGGWDWVVHLHPDIYVVDERPLLNALLAADATESTMLVTKIFGNDHPSFATDFFAFRPQHTPRALFDSYLPLLGQNVIVPLENLFFIEILQNSIQYSIAPRFIRGHYFRDVDKMGLWHEHQLERVRLYFFAPPFRWLVTFIRICEQPYLSARLTFAWLLRKLRRTPQDALAKQLTIC